MKKYMVHLMVLFFIVHANAMQNEWETTEAFIQRTKRYEDIPLNDLLVLSRDGKRKAVINFYEDYGKRAHLTISSKWRNKKVPLLELSLPAEWKCITTMHFNEQCTLFLVRGISCDDEGMQRKERMLIPLNVAEYYWRSVIKRKK